MSISETRSVSITQSGRSGLVTYVDSGGELSFHWEYGGADALVIVQAGTREAWKEQYAWAVPRRDEILRFVAAEVRRQKSPQSRAEISDQTGDIVLRQVGPAPAASPPPDVAWYYRLRQFRLKLALGMLAVSLIFAGLLGLKNTFLVIDPGKGTPIGLSVRTDEHIATLIRTLEAYTPALHRDAGKDRYTVSVFIVPLNGGAPQLVRLAKGLQPNQYALARVLGSDGRTLWVDVGEISTVDLVSFDVEPYAGAVPQNLQGAQASPFPPDVNSFLSAGFLLGSGEWLGLHSNTELEGEFKLQKFVRRVVAARSGKEPRRFCRGIVEPESSGKYYQLLSLTPLSDVGFINAAFLRMDEKSEPLQLADPPSALMLYTSDAGLKGTAMIARVDQQGTSLWNVDTGIDRFRLAQILPGRDAMALVGTHPSEEGKVPEPLLVIVNNSTGNVLGYSLWQ